MPEAETRRPRGAVVTISDACSRGEREDASGMALQELLASMADVAEQRTIPDDRPTIEATLRELSDAGIDLLLTRDPATLAYAATLPQFQLLPLEWQRTHVLLSPGRASSSLVLSNAARQRLADDAIRGEARGAVGPFWWDTAQGCDAGAALLATSRNRAKSRS